MNISEFVYTRYVKDKHGNKGQNNDVSCVYLSPMVAYFCPLHASYFSTDYVNMQDTYVNMRDNYVNMQDN